MDLFDFDAALVAEEKLRWVVFEDEREIKFLFDLDPALDIDGATEVTVYRLAENGSRCGLRLCWRSGKANRARLAAAAGSHERLYGYRATQSARDLARLARGGRNLTIGHWQPPVAKRLFRLVFGQIVQRSLHIIVMRGDRSLLPRFMSLSTSAISETRRVGTEGVSTCRFW